MDPGTEAPLLGRLLPALQVLSLVCLAIAGLSVVATTGTWSGFGAVVAITYLAAIPVVAGMWILRAHRRSPRGRALLSLLVSLVLLPVALLGAVGFTIPVLLLAVALVVVDSGRRAGYLAALVVGLAGTVLHLTSGNGLAGGLMNALPIVVLLCFGVALGSALRASQDAHDRDQRTIAERDRALDRLEEAISRLRRTSEVEKELLLADERARSARDLHDGLGHRLTLISMSLQFAQRTRDADPGRAWDEIATADATAREAMTEMRTWVRALSPVRDAEATGAAAFEAIAESFRGSGLDVEVETAGEDLPLVQEASLLLYRTVQEGLTNALRHGRSEQARITYDTRGGELVLRLVSDLDRQARAQLPPGELAPGFGLRGLADRAAALDGHARAEHRDGDVELTIRLPRQHVVDDSEIGRELTS